MTRPYIHTPAGWQPDQTAILYVHRPLNGPAWRLAWATPDSTTYISAEGECSRREFHTRDAAVRHGIRVYGEHATYTAHRAPFGPYKPVPLRA